MEKLFLLDAYALIYRAYYAFLKAPRINSKGFNTSAVLGFVNTLEEILTKEKPTHIGVAFDPKGGTFRHELYKEYKAQREETPEVIRESVPIIKQILVCFICHICKSSLLHFRSIGLFASVKPSWMIESFGTPRCLYIFLFLQ